MKDRLTYFVVIFFGIFVLAGSAWAQVSVQKSTRFKAPSTVQKQSTQQPLPSKPIPQKNLDAHRVGAPLPPTLVGPANNFKFFASSHFDNAISFSWQRPTSGPALKHYRLCITKPGILCGQQGSAVYPNIYQPSRIIQIPAALRGNLTWTVAACNKNGCSRWQTPRALVASLYPPAPNLVGPAHGLRSNTPRPGFSWSRVIGADSYLLCVSRPGKACPKTRTSTRDTQVVPIPISQTSHTPSLFPFLGSAVNWTVAACHGTYCSYQPKIRAMTVVPVPTPIGPQDGTQYRFHDSERYNPIKWRGNAQGVQTKIRFFQRSPNSSNINVLYERIVQPDHSTRGWSGGEPLKTALKPAAGQEVLWQVGVVNGSDQAWSRTKMLKLPRAIYSAALHLSIKVHDDCDNVSPGDLNFTYQASVGVHQVGTIGETRNNWGGYRNIESGTHVLVEMPLTYFGCAIEQDYFRVYLAGEDCDRVACGEEAVEALTAGGDDSLGSTGFANFTDWVNNPVKRLNGGPNECQVKTAFTAYFEVKKRQIWP